MASDRLSGPEKRGLILWVVLGIAGAVFASQYFFRAFPEASVDFQVSRGEALKRAQNFVSGLGENISGYQSAIIFDVDDNAKTYLERELGLKQANQMMSSQLNIWYWDVRFFRPQQEEEFKVRVSPAGNIVGYEHKIEEARAGELLDRSVAQEKAQNFLTRKLGLDLNGWDFLPEQANSRKRPNRLDWTFTWEKHDFRAKDAPYRLQAAVYGDRIGGSEQYLQVPELWKRSYAQLRSTNIFYNTIAIIPFLLLNGAALWLGISLWRQRQTTWMLAIKLGIVVALLLFFMQLNTWPLERAGYDTNSSYGSFVLRQIAGALLFGLGSALLIAVVLPGAEPLYRASQPGRLRLAEAFTLRGLRSKEFFSAAVVGLSLAAAHIGFIVAFYIVAGNFGAWAPQELNFDNSINTTFPWIAGVAIGLYAATSEEFLFRLFAIPFLERVTRSRVLAVIIPAFCWSFLHSAYPQEPGYIRGIEVGLIGIVAGVVMLRWGILATLIWHYTVDASLVGLLLIRSNSLYFKISGVVVALAAVAPLIFAASSYFSRGRFEQDEDLLNEAAPVPDISLVAAPVAATQPATTSRYAALKPGALAFLAICVFAGGGLAWRFKPESIGDYLKVSVNARGARARADEAMRQRGLNPGSYRQTAVLLDWTDPLNNEFLRERVGIARANEIYANEVPGAFWRVRYFRDSQPEEYAVVLKPDGSLYSVHHVLAEAVPGASLSKEEAIRRAEKYLREEKKIDLSQWTLVEPSSEKRPHRTDHTLTWQQNRALDPEGSNASGHAYARMGVGVLGDEVADFHTFIKIPDDWRRKQKELTLGRTIFNYAVPYLFFVGFGGTALVIYLTRLRSEEARRVPWKRFARWSLWGFVGYLLVFVFGNRLATILNAYDTSNPLKYTFGGIGVASIIGAAFYIGAITILFGAAWYYGLRAFGEEQLAGWRGMPGSYYRDALWIGVGGTCGLLGLQALIRTAAQYWPTVHRAMEATFGTEFDATLPAGSILGGTILRGLLRTGLIALVASFIAAEVRQSWARASLFVVAALAFGGMSGDWGSPADLIKQALAQAIWLGVVVAGVRYIVRFNLLGYFLVLAGISLVSGMAALLGQPDGFYRANGYACLVMFVAIVLIWPIVAWRANAGRSGVGEPGGQTA